MGHPVEENGITINEEGSILQAGDDKKHPQLTKEWERGPCFIGCYLSLTLTICYNLML